MRAYYNLHILCCSIADRLSTPSLLYSPSILISLHIIHAWCCLLWAFPFKAISFFISFVFPDKSHLISIMLLSMHLLTQAGDSQAESADYQAASPRWHVQSAHFRLLVQYVAVLQAGKLLWGLPDRPLQFQIYPNLTGQAVSMANWKSHLKLLGNFSFTYI